MCVLVCTGNAVTSETSSMMNLAIKVLMPLIVRMTAVRKIARLAARTAIVPLLLAYSGMFSQSAHSTVAACNLITDIPFSQCMALSNFYNATGGSAWTNKTNWFTGRTASAWHGVYVANGQVSQIILANNKLTGVIPNMSGLPGLTNLTYLATPSRVHLIP